jgi:peptide/nickel transport system substrate-binding protein
MKARPRIFAILLVGFLFVSSLVAACQQASENTTVVYGLTLAPSGLDPHINASAELGIPLQSVYDTLIVRHPETGDFLPSLALSWEISPDGRTYTFNLRQDVHFHDGSRFDAYAAVKNFEYVMNPDHNSQKAAAMLGPYQEAVATDDFTLQVHLAEPFAPLLDSLSQVYLGMASPDALEQWGPGEYQFHQVGTGPFRFVAYIPNDRIILERSAVYTWGPSIFENQDASVERIEFRFFEDEATRALALERGEVDIIGEVPPQDAIRLTGQGDYVLHAVPIPGQPMQFFFNTQFEPTNDLLVRQALIAGVDRSRILSTLFGDLSPIARGPLSAYPFDQLLPEQPAPFDPDLAKRTLEQAGWIDNNGDGIREKNQRILRLNLVVPPWGSNPEAAQLIKVDWEALGAQVNLEIVSAFGSLKQARDEGRYHVIGLNFFGTDADLLRTFYLSDGVYNWSQYQSETLDDLLMQAASEIDLEQRTSLYREVIQIINDQALILPIRDYINPVVQRQTLSNLHFSAQGWFPYLIDLESNS